MGFTTSDLTDPILADFISDQQAFVERMTRLAYIEGDDDFELARAFSTRCYAAREVYSFTSGGRPRALGGGAARRPSGARAHPASRS